MLGLVLESVVGGMITMEPDATEMLAVVAVVLLLVSMLDVDKVDINAGGIEATLAKVEPGGPVTVRVPSNPPKALGLEPAVTADWLVVAGLAGMAPIPGRGKICAGHAQAQLHAPSDKMFPVPETTGDPEVSVPAVA